MELEKVGSKSETTKHETVRVEKNKKKLNRGGQKEGLQRAFQGEVIQA